MVAKLDDKRVRRDAVAAPVYPVSSKPALLTAFERGLRKHDSEKAAR